MLILPLFVSIFFLSCTRNRQAQLGKFFDYGRVMNASITQALGATGVRRGAFLSACIVHCETIFNEGEDRFVADSCDV